MSIQNGVRKLFDIDYGTLEEADRAYVYNRMNELMTARFSRLESQTIVALSNAEEAKDLYTKGHSQRVAKYSRELAFRMGFDILKIITEIPEISVGAKWHHEKISGTGYPDGLTGDEIPEIARIIAVADAYDAMTSTRSYRAIMPQAAVRSEIEKIPEHSLTRRSQS